MIHIMIPTIRYIPKIRNGGNTGLLYCYNIDRYSK